MATLTASPILLGDPLDQVDLELIHDPDNYAARVTRAGQLSDPSALCCAVAHAAVDAFHGTRPLSQLARLVSPGVYDQLSARARAQQEVNKVNGVAVPSRARAQSGRATRATTRVLRARVLRVSPVAAEATVVVLDGSRVRAAALRVEEFRGRWRVSVLQIG